MIPPFSPVLLAGAVLAPLPPPLLQPLCTLAMTLLTRRRPDLWDRLRGLGVAKIGLDPVDLPFLFVLDPGEPPSLTLHRERPAGLATAIRAPLEVFLALAAGQLDGDAAFFSRRLAIEGDTQAVLALRNALDDMDALPGLASLLRLIGRAGAPMSFFQQTVTGAVQQRTEILAARIEALDEAVGDLRRSARLRGRPA